MRTTLNGLPRKLSSPYWRKAIPKHTRMSINVHCPIGPPEEGARSSRNPAPKPVIAPISGVLSAAQQSEKMRRSENPPSGSRTCVKSASWMRNTAKKVIALKVTRRVYIFTYFVAVGVGVGVKVAPGVAKIVTVGTGVGIGLGGTRASRGSLAGG